jgi:hypothetical protein
MVLFLVAVVVWAVIPTREGLKMFDPKLLAPVALLALVDFRAMVFALALYLAYIRYLEGSFMREKFPFLHALFVAVILYLAIPLPQVLGV